MRDGGATQHKENAAWEMLTEVVNMCYRQRRAMYFTEAITFLAFRLQYFVIWTQTSVYKEFTIPR